MNIIVDNNTVKGEGKNLYSIATIDEDHEDTVTELWLADNEDDLYESVKKDFIGEDIEDGEKFEADWGFEILYTFIGTVESTNAI